MNHEIFQKQFAIFDFDGTLADSVQEKGTWYQVNAMTLEVLKIDANVEEFDRLVCSTSVNGTAEHIKNTYDVPHSLQEIRDIYQQSCQRVFATCGFVPGAEQLIHQLDAQKIKIGIATASPAYVVEAFFSQRPELRAKIGAIFSCEDGIAPKPDPEVYRKCLEQLGGEHFGQCTIFEDSSTGLRGARNAGAYVVGVAYCWKHEHQNETLADVVVKEFTQILK